MGKRPRAHEYGGPVKISQTFDNENKIVSISSKTYDFVSTGSFSRFEVKPNNNNNQFMVFDFLVVPRDV